MKMKNAYTKRKLFIYVDFFKKCCYNRNACANNVFTKTHREGGDPEDKLKNFSSGLVDSC